MTKVARGDLRKIIIKLGRIQDLAGNAKGVYLNDRAPDRAEKLLPLLDEIFNICIDIRGKYEPVWDKEK